MLFYLFYKAVKIVVCMSVIVTFNAPSNARTTCVTYKLATVLHVNLNGLGRLVFQVCRIINLSFI